MREILFRGKRTDNGAWVEGAFCLKDCESPFGEMADRPSIIKYGRPFDGYWFRVDPETVGQFTGLTDKNGKKIFEGDIVHVLGNQQVEDWKNVNYIGSTAFLDAGFCVIDGTIEDHAFRRYKLPRLDFDLEVIGNIHDNPELLEVGVDG